MFASLLRESLAGICDLSPHQIQQLQRHYELLIRWNQVLNLTGLHKIEQIVERHYCESLYLGAYLPPQAITVADVGSGAGFPGFPVAILRPDCSVTLIESHQRKAVFLRESGRLVKNIRVLAKRAELVQEQFDWVISRAVKYSDIQKSLDSLGRNAGILTGEVPASALPGFDWQEPIRLPWGRQRWLWIGQSVSRET